MLLKLAFEFDTPPPKSYRNKKNMAVWTVEGPDMARM